MGRNLIEEKTLCATLEVCIDNPSIGFILCKVWTNNTIHNKIMNNNIDQ